MDRPDVYPDVLGDALSHSSQRLAQLGSLVTAAAMMEARRKTEANAADAARNERELGALREQQRAAWQLARTRWAPAHDARWLAQADLLQAAQVWSAAAAHAEADPAAAAALRKCEERLRVLHPYAMARYDRLRSEGAGAVEAMRQAVPLFGRAPRARPGDAGAERRALEASAGLDAASLDSGAGGPREPDRGLGQGQRVDERGHRLVQRLQASTLAERGYRLSPDELATTLGATTTLPGDVIARLAHAGGHDRGVAGTVVRPGATGLGNASARRSWDEDGNEQFDADSQAEMSTDAPSTHISGARTAAQLAAEGFPYVVTDVVMAAKTGKQAGLSGTRTVTPHRTRRPGRSG